LKINFSGLLQRCVVCHDWIVLPSGQSPVKFCPYCGSSQTTRESGGETVRSQLKSTGDSVSKSDAALISLRLQQSRIKSGLDAAQTGKPAESTTPAAGASDPYPAPGGDFSPTLKDVVGDHVLIGNSVLIAADLAFALFGLLSSVAFLEILVGIVATGTIVDTWVHEFFH
jgi:hypothetical protein